MPTKKAARKRVRRKSAAKKTKRTKKWAEVPTTAMIEIPDTEEGAAADPAGEIEEPELTEDDADVEDVLEQLPQEARVELWMWDGKLDDWGYLAKYPAHGFNIDMVSREYGPGKYRMIIRGPLDGRMRIRGKKVFVIGGAPLTTAGGGAGRMVETGLADLVRIQGEVMRTNMSRPQESTAEIMRMMAEVMRPAPAPAPAADPFRTAIEIVQLLKEGMGGEKNTTMKDVKELLELGAEMGASGGGDDGLNVFGKSLASLLERLEKKPAAVTPATGAAPQLPAAETDAMKELKEFFETANKVLAGAAVRKADLDFYAEWLADNVPDTLDPYFSEWFNDPSYPDVLLSVFPDVAPEWLRPLLLKARALLLEPAEEPSANKVSDPAPAGDGDGPAAPEGGPGDIQDTPGNEPPNE